MFLKNKSMPIVKAIGYTFKLVASKHCRRLVQISNISQKLQIWCENFLNAWLSDKASKKTTWPLSCNAITFQ
jgi:hypothetical protein